MKDKPFLLWRIGWRTLARHPWQTALMVIGVMLGVAVVVSIDVANESASRAFELSVEAVAGRATHEIAGGPQGLDEAVYANLRAEGPLREAAPVVTDMVSSPQLGDRPYTLLGIDPFAEAPFRSYLGGEQGAPIGLITAFLTRPGAILISSDVASRYGLAEGDRITLAFGGREREAVIAGLLEPADSLSRRTLDGLILADVATAQELTGRLGRLDRIDLILPEDDATYEARIAALLPEGIRLRPVEARSGTLEQMTAAFQLNLTALSLLALVVGMFLIANTMTFSVVQRRALFGTLRALGVTRREVFLMVMGEALAVGILGAALGAALGVALGQGAVRLVARTINDLFFALSVQGVQIPPASLAKGVLLGVAATLLAAALPGWEAASAPPRATLTRSMEEERAQRGLPRAAIGGLGALLAGAALLLVNPHDGLLTSFAGTFAVVIGCALLVPWLMRHLLRLVAPLAGWVWGPLGRMAPRRVEASLSRTAVAVAALMVAVSVTIGISLMVGSFRHTVEVWLAQTLRGDVYISVPGGPQTAPSAVIDPEVLSIVAQWPGVQRVDTVRAAEIDAPGGPVQVLAVNNPDSGSARLYLAADGPPEAVWRMVEDGAVIVSEPLARRAGIPRQGGSVTLSTPQGERAFPVVGIYYDYGSTQGQVMMAQQVYHAIWGDQSVTAVALLLEPGVDVDATTGALESTLAPVQQLLVRPNQALRDDVMVIFDQTFAITGALNLLATLVAFVGVLSALLSLQLEKQRELGILRAIGLTVRQVWGLTLIETGLMGAVAGLLALPTGFALALILIFIINRRAFGWTLQLQVEPGPFVLALVVAIGAALLAGVYPARRIGQMAAADAIRFE